MFHVLEVRKPGKTKSEIVEIEAPDFVAAVKQLAAEFPGITLIKAHSGKKPEAKQ